MCKATTTRGNSILSFNHNHGHEPTVDAVTAINIQTDLIDDLCRLGVPNREIIVAVKV